MTERVSDLRPKPDSAASAVVTDVTPGEAFAKTESHSGLRAA